MVKNEDQDAKARHIGAVFQPDAIDRLDAWRKAQPGALNRSQALRLIVEEKLPAPATKGRRR